MGLRPPMMWEINHAMLRKDLADFLSAYELNDLAQKARRGEYDIGQQSTAGEMAGP